MIDKEQIEQEVFEEVYKKQAKFSKVALNIVLGFLLAFCLIPGIILLYTCPAGTENFEGGIAFAIMAGVILIIMILLNVLLTKRMDYQKYKQRADKFKNKYGMYNNSVELYTRLEVLERRIEELENERR